MCVGAAKFVKMVLGRIPRPREALFLRVAGVALLCLSLPAQAAQEATVIVEDAAIRSAPNQDASVLEFKKLGSSVRISSNTRDGWFKTKSSKGGYGWLWQADVLISNSKADTQAASLDFVPRPLAARKDRQPPRLYLRAGGKLLAGMNSNISYPLGLGKYHVFPNFGGYGEIAVRIDNDLRLAARAEYLGGSSAVSAYANTYTVSNVSTPVLIGLDADVIRGESWDFGAGVYLGASSNSFTVTATSLAAPNSFTVSDFNYVGLINFTARYWLGLSWAFVAELGAHVSPCNARKITSDFNGSSPFLRSDGQLSSARPTLTGPYSTVGLQVAL